MTLQAAISLVKSVQFVKFVEERELSTNLTNFTNYTNFTNQQSSPRRAENVLHSYHTQEGGALFEKMRDCRIRFTLN